MEFLTYDLKVAVLIAVFYMFYRLLLSRETFHRVNRIVLLATAITSFLLPLCVITLHQTVVIEAPLPSIEKVVANAPALVQTVETSSSVSVWEALLITAFFAGMAVTLGFTLYNIIRVWLLIRHSEQHSQQDGIVICVTRDDVSPFSWMHYIVLSQSDYEASNASLLAHERGHIHRHHSLDLILVDTLTALQWFNPAMWMLRQDLRAIHEYEADAAVLSQGINMRQYQYLLIQKAVSRCGYSVANGISHSTLKNRIDMMLHKKSNSARLLKLLALLPIVGTTLALQAETVNDYVFDNTQQEPQKKVVKKGKKAGQVKMGAKTIEVKAETKAEQKAKQDPKPATVESPKIVIPETSSEHEPLLILDGKIATREQVKALDQNEVEKINVVKPESKDVLEAYAKHYNAETSNGIIFIVTKAYMEYKKANPDKTPVVVVVKKKPQEEEVKESNDVVSEDVSDHNIVFDVVEHMPSFPGGQMELLKYISENIRYPKEAEEKGKQGRVVLTFIIEKDGSISHVDVAKKVSEELDAEAVRVISSMPKWTPGMQNGKNVRVKYTVPVTFRLN